MKIWIVWYSLHYEDREIDSVYDSKFGADLRKEQLIAQYPETYYSHGVEEFEVLK